MVIHRTQQIQKILNQRSPASICCELFRLLLAKFKIQIHLFI